MIDLGALRPAFLDSNWSIWNTIVRKLQIYYNLIFFTKQVVQRRKIIKLLILFSQSQEILPIMSVLFLQDLEVLNRTTKMLL